MDVDEVVRLAGGRLVDAVDRLLGLFFVAAEEEDFGALLVELLRGDQADPVRGACDGGNLCVKLVSASRLNLQRTRGTPARTLPDKSASPVSGSQWCPFEKPALDARVLSGQTIVLANVSKYRVRRACKSCVRSPIEGSKRAREAEWKDAVIGQRAVAISHRVFAVLPTPAPR